MVDLKTQRKIIDLGKVIVKDLRSDSGVDTLSRWMAHYIAEKIELAQKLTGSKRSNAEKECFDIILKLWENRWSIPPIRKYLERFMPLLDTLEKLNPDKRKPFFYPERVAFDIEEQNEKDKSSSVKNILDEVLKVDKLARSIISDLLRQAATQLELDEEKTEYIRNAIELGDSHEIDNLIIELTSDYDKYLDGLENDKEVVDAKKERIEEVQRRINDLEVFASLQETLLEKYKTELKKLSI